MARTDRLFRLLHVLRLVPQPVTAARLAEETGVSLRSIYRDIDALRAAGARIDGAAGAGYTLEEDAALPPQTLSQIEVEALSIGLSDVVVRGDPALSDAAESALAKITARLPGDRQRQMLHAVSLVRRYAETPPRQVDTDLLRTAAWDEVAIDIAYTDKAGAETARRILPLALVYTDSTEVLLAWCCLRADFRMFLVPSIRHASRSDDSFRPRRVTLLRDYIARMRAEGCD